MNFQNRSGAGVDFFTKSWSGVGVKFQTPYTTGLRAPISAYSRRRSRAYFRSACCTGGRPMAETFDVLIQNHLADLIDLHKVFIFYSCAHLACARWESTFM